MKILTLIIICLAFSGCSSLTKITYDITSDPPNAPIDVNGMNVGVTPTTATLECSKRWVGIMNAPGGRVNISGDYEIKAYPPKGFNGQSQTKNVDPCQWKGKNNPTIQFDLGLVKVAPIQKIEITTNNKENNNIQESIYALKTLRNSGVITEEEYKAKILELVK